MALNIVSFVSMMPFVSIRHHEPNIPIVRHRTRGEWEAWRRKYPNGGIEALVEQGSLAPYSTISHTVHLPCLLLVSPLIYFLCRGKVGQSSVGPVPFMDQAIISAPHKLVG